MRVLMTADAVGGVWQYALQLSSLLAAGHNDVLVATMGPAPSVAQQTEAAAIPRLTLRTSTFRLEWMPDPWDDVNEAGNWLLHLETEFAPDVIHINGYAHGALPWHAPALVVAHSDVCSWWHAVHGTAPPASWHEYIERVSAGAGAASAIAAPTQAMADAFTRCYRVGRRITIIPNARDASAWRPARKEPFIFTAGRAWDPAKNVATLDAIARDIDWPVFAAGDTDGPSSSRPPLTALRALGRMQQAELTDWMARASIYASPARYEPFGLSILEAAFSGCALVLGDIPSLRENWAGVARFVHPDRADELRDTLRELIVDADMRLELAAAARRRAAAFSPAAQVAAYERLYREMVTTHGRIAHSSRTL